jgi:Holliday junction resolvase-like predicted endonuclease
MNKRQTGSRYEETAAAFLTSKGYRVLERNFRCRQGEIDLICRHGRRLNTVPGCPWEVRQRLLTQGSRRGYGGQRPFICTAMEWAQMFPAGLTW